MRHKPLCDYEKNCAVKTPIKVAHAASCFCSFLLLALIAPSASALDPAQPTMSYLHTTLTVDDGLPDNVVNAIVQSRDGFLWIGTGGGLVRFNGRDFTPIGFRMPGTVSHTVLALAETPDGSLWVGTNLGVLRILDVEHYDPETSTILIYHPGAAKDDEIACLKVTHDGMLFAGTQRGLYRLNGTSFVLVLPGKPITSIEEAPDGHLLMEEENYFVEWDGSRIIEHPGLAAALTHGVGSAEARRHPFYYIMADHTGARWFCTIGGVARQEGKKILRYNPEDTRVQRPQRTYEDRQGTVWVVKAPDVGCRAPCDGESGIFRARRDSLEPLLTGVTPRCLLTDHDGNLWIGTNGDGLIRFRDKPIHMFTSADGLPNNVPMAVLQRHDGSIWVGNNCGGLSRFDGKRFITYKEKDGLINSCVWSLAEDGDDNLWIGTWGGGLFRFKDDRFEQYARGQGLQSGVVRSIVSAADGSLWIATSDGLSRMRDGHIRTYTTADGLSSNHVTAVYADRHGGVWAGTSLGIDRMTGDRFVPLHSVHQLFDPQYLSFGAAPSGELYALSAPRGISRIEANRLVEIDTRFDLLSMASYRGRELWFSGRNGVSRLSSASAGRTWDDPDDPPDYTVFGRADGLNSTQCSVGSPNLFIDREGRLWVATVEGLAMINLPKLPHERRRPAIFIEEATVDRRTQMLPHRVLLPPGDHHLELKFDAIELTSPEKIRFQYRMDGVERAWLDAGATRTAIYTGVPIGTHWFHIRACNSDGVWDRLGVAYAITQQPFFYETNGFRLIALSVLILLAAGIYRLRMRQVATELNVRMEERMDERMRIARDLHDTLLQSFQGLLLRFQAARNMLPERPEEAEKALAIALDRGIEAVAEARNTVENLRESTTITNDLARELVCLCKDLQSSSLHPTTATVTVEGEVRELHTMLGDEIFRIAGEALRNAFQHAEARRIRVSITYGARELRLHVRDDGKGIDPGIVSHGGLQGHWGLSGMRERAESIGGRLEVRSALGTGTQILLRIPAARAYLKSSTRRWRLLGDGEYE